MGRKWLRKSWLTPVLLAAMAVGVVLAAPLAVPHQAAGHTVSISGARSLSDQVMVRYAANLATSTTDVHLLAFNDLHGTLEAGGNNIYGHFAGGAAYLAKAIKDRQAQYGNLEATIFAGDNIGASPLANGLFFEEPITIATNMMHVDFGSVGNHEFDKGSVELLRIQNGGCRPVDGCTAAPYRLPDGSTTNVYPGANFKYLSANVIRNATGEPLFPAYGVKQFQSAGGKSFKIGFIGEVLKSTPTIVTPTGVAGLTFQDEADAANRTLQQLQQNGVKTSVLVIHEGGFQTGAAALNGCGGNLAGSPIADIASRLDPSIKVIVSAHTHAEYRCTITAGGVTRLITSASSFGRILSDITLTIDDDTGELTQASAQNIIVDNALNPSGPGVTRVPDTSKEDPQVQAVVGQYVTAAAPLGNKVIGRIQGNLTRTGSPFGETTIGDVIADAQLVATQPTALGGAKVAFMNPGGIRGDLNAADISSGGEAIGEVTYGEAFTVQPFGNSLVTKTMTGDMIRRLLEEQFTGCGGQTVGKTLQISYTLSYEQAPGASTCAARIGRIWINGVEVGPADSFRVTMNNFLATGGDGFGAFNEGTDALGGAQDIDAFVAAFDAAKPAGIAVPPLNRIVALPPPPANLLPDGDFESQPQPSYFTSGSCSFDWQTTQSHSATHSLQITSPSPQLCRWLSQTQGVPAAPGQTYQASAFFRTGSVQGGVAYLSVNFWTADGTYIPSTVDSPLQLSGSNDWTQLVVKTKAPPNAAFVRLELRLTGSGQAWIDDAQLAASSPDATPPDTTITGGPDGTVASSTASFTFTSNEAGSGFSCSLDGAAFNDCSTPRGYTGVALGAHTFAVRAQDPAGNIDPSPATRAWTVVTSLPGTNLAPDPGFEQDPAGSYATSGAAAFTWASDAGHSGDRSLKIAATADGLARWLSDLSLIAVTPGATYQGSVWAKTQGVTGSAYLSVNFWTAAGVYIPATVDSTIQLSGSQDWTKLSVQAIAPAGAAHARIELRQSGPGTSWFDDVDLQRQ